MSQAIVKDKAKKTGRVALEASYHDRLSQIRKDYRDIVKQIKEIRRLQKVSIKLKAEIKELLHQEKLQEELNLPDVEKTRKTRQDKESAINGNTAKIARLEQDMGKNFGHKITNKVNALEADTIKLGKDHKTLPSFIKQRHLEGLVAVSNSFLGSFVKHEAWLRRLVGADKQLTDKKSEEEMKARIDRLETTISSLDTKEQMLPFFRRFKNGTLVEFARFNKQVAEVKYLIESLAKYADRASDEGVYRGELDDPYGKFNDIPLHQLNDSFHKKQGLILDSIVRQLGIITREQEAKFRNVKPISYEPQLAFLQKILESQQPLGVVLRTKAISEEEARFKKEDNKYLAAQDNEAAQAKLLSEHMTEFKQSSSCDKTLLSEKATLEEIDQYLEQKNDYALLFKRSFNPLGLKNKERADTYVLNQLTKLYYAMVSAEAARITLITADKQVITDQLATETKNKDDKPVKEDSQEVGGALGVSEQSVNADSNYQPQRFFPSVTSVSEDKVTVTPEISLQ